MRHSLIVSSLLAAAATFAQPIEGPFTIVELDSLEAVGLHRLAAGNGDTLFVFFENRPAGGSTRVSWTSYSFASHELLRPIEPLGYTAGWRHALHDAMILADGRCAASIYRVAPSDSQISETILFRMSVAGISDSYVLFRGYHIYPCWYSCFDLVSTRFAPRIGGGFLLCGAVASRFQFGYDETDYWPHFWAFPATGNRPDWDGSHVPNTLFGSENNWIVSLAPDTFLLLTQGYGWGESYLSRCFPEVCTDTTLECRVRPLGFVRTSGDRLIIASGDSYYPDSYEMFELQENGSCMELGNFAITVVPAAVALHPAFGFAAVTRFQSGLELVRFDTMGTEVASRGMICWPESGYELVSAFCMIVPDGRVFTQCMERSQAMPSHYRLLVTSVGWATPLSITESSPSPPMHLDLAAYPNPFNSELRVEYDLPKTQDIELTVLNTLGQKVETIASGRQTAGVHHQIWRPLCGSGIYWIVLNSNGMSAVKKVAYLR